MEVVEENCIIERVCENFHLHIEIEIVFKQVDFLSEKKI